jgi:hypothetical protein|tara:strand:+ start:781 stop:1602 length:822 start_codon:yes stop_codon:yes gene_type:complete
MARLIDPLDEQELNLQEGEELVNLLDDGDEAEVVAKEAQPEVTEEPNETVVPEKYSGKSIEDIVQMHQEAEKLVGRQGAEVGELRKIVDDFIKTKANEAKQPVTDDLDADETDFFDNPKEAVAKAISGSAEMQQMQALLAKNSEQDILAKLNSKHPDFMKTIEDPSFSDWIKASVVRTELLQRADKYDFNAADELLTVWAERKGDIKAVKEVNDKDRQQQRKAATTGGKGSGEPISRKIYKRSDIVNLMMTDPARYKRNVEEFDKAYAEGRVK